MRRFLAPALALALTLGPVAARAFAPEAYAWSATWDDGDGMGNPEDRSDGFEDGFPPGDPSDTGDSEPACGTFELGDEANSLLTFDGPTFSPPCIPGPDPPFGNQIAHFNFDATGEMTVTGCWKAIPPTQPFDSYGISASVGTDFANLVVTLDGTDVVVALLDEGGNAAAFAGLGPLASFPGATDSVELELTLTQSGANLLPSGRYKLSSTPECGSGSFLPLINLPPNAALDAASSHGAFLIASFTTPKIPAVGPLGVCVLAAFLVGAGCARLQTRSSATVRSRVTRCDSSRASTSRNRTVSRPGDPLAPPRGRV